MKETNIHTGIIRRKHTKESREGIVGKNHTQEPYEGTVLGIIGNNMKLEGVVCLPSGISFVKNIWQRNSFL
jgi:hypothetical protein